MDGVVGFETVRSGLKDKSRSQGKAAKPSRAGWSSRFLDFHHVQVGRKNTVEGDKNQENRVGSM